METKRRVTHLSDDRSLSLEERVRLRAYQLYVERGNQSGSELDDWLQAEDELAAAEEERVYRD